LQETPVFSLPGFEITSTTTVESILTITALSNTPSARCPVCSAPSDRIHSYYTRTPRDLPVSTFAVRLVLHVRRFRCLEPDCPRKSFAERLPELVPVAAQRTLRLTQALERVGVALGGEAGARLCRRLAVPTSPDTLLRVVRRIQTPPAPTPRVLGVDDWAIRRGHTYGSILVDLEHHRPIDLLADRTAETFAAWLEAHPGVELISRDRSTEYARGARLGAPAARQILDRWHLLRNLSQAVERFLDRVRRRLVALPLAPGSSPPQPSVFDRETRRSTTEQAARQERRARRLSRFERVHELAAQGISRRQIAQKLKLSRTTVQFYLEQEQFPERAQSRRPSKLDPYAPYLQERWDAGCHNGVLLWREIRERGFSGTRRLVSNWVVLRRERLLGRHSGFGRRPALPEQLTASSQTAPKGAEHPALPPPRQLVWVLLKEARELSVEEMELLKRLEQDREFQVVFELSRRFRQLVRTKQPDLVEPWLSDAMTSTVPEIRNFASSLAREKAELLAALELPYSNGQVEGQVTKLKLLKRQGYGRAKLDLLRQRLLHAA
jgi:transposase